MRLEKLLYEQIINSSLLRRSRVIEGPKKWYAESRNDELKVQVTKLFSKGITGAIIRKLEYFYSYFGYKWARDIYTSRGLAFEDFFLHQERELRRCYLFENILRQSVHPYHFIFLKYRKARYYKVERGVRGFQVPDYLRKEAADRLAGDTIRNKEIWDDYVYQNFMSDMTPGGRSTAVPRFIPLEIFNYYGFFKSEGWNRYFFNEKNYGASTEKELENVDPVSDFDLNSKEGREEFEKEIERFIDYYPGSIVKEGEKFNFEEFYRIRKLKGKARRDPSKGLVHEMKGNLQKMIDEKSKSNKSVIGTILPSFIRKKPGKAIQN